jgi:class 3 adenylate cyclase/tetratricopeptide (TPR) repeat protein
MGGIQMECPNCQFENPQDVRFCVQCGIKLEIICVKCGSSNSPTFNYCGECGYDLNKSTEPASLETNEHDTQISDSPPEKTVPARIPPESERKHVTVLFSDLSGYTAMSERLDPEEVKEIMSQIFGEVAQVVTKYEGFIEKFIGDAVMALFGVPQTHEDDPVRAIKAAREIHATVNALNAKLEEKIGQPLEMHSGINTGLVVTGDVDTERGTHGVVGDTINLASRLADLAKPGEIIISMETRQLSAPHFKVKELEPITIKGKAQSISAYRVEEELGIATLFDASAKQGFTVYTGREQELTLLHSCLEETVADKGQFVTLVGEAGVGKSRLLYEFQNSIGKNKVKVWQGYCQSFWSATNYFPFINILRRELHLPEERRAKDVHEIAVSSICAINQKLEKYLPLYLNLLSIPSEDYPLPEDLEGQELKNAFQDAIATFSILKSERQPLVLILEDWQWVDEASDSALKHLVSVIGAHPLMVVTIYRPIYSSNWGNWSYHTPIVLKPLDSLHSKNIVKSVFGVEHLPEGLAELIITRAGGNPFFIEEVCHSLIEGGVIEVHEAKQAILTQALETLAIPDKVQAIISARLDRLDPDTKETLRIASVIGRRFERKILEKIYKGKILLAQVLEELKALEMIQQIGVFPEAEYWFRHTLTKEVVYNSLLLRRRKILHGLVGQITEELYPDRIEEQVNLLRYHFSMAESWPKAVHYGRLSAEKALKLSQFHDAATLLEHVLEWLLQLPEDRLRLETQFDILLQQERLYETLGQRGQQQKIINKLISLVEPDKDQAFLAEIYMRQGDLYTQIGNYDEAERVLNDVINNSRSLSDALGESRSLRSMGFLRWHQGRNKEAIKCNEEALDIDRQREDPMAIATDLTNLGAVWRNFGDPKRSLKCLEEALKIYEATQKPVKQAFTLYSIANVHRERDALDHAITQYRQAHEIFEQYHDRVMSSRALAGIASIYREQGRVHESLHLYKDVVKVTREINFRQGLSHALRAVGELLLTLNKPRQALDHFLESTEVFAELKDKQSEAEIWEKIGNIYEENLDEHEEALGAWKRTKELQIILNDDSSAIETLERMARLARQQLSDSALALRYFHDAFDIAVKIGNRKRQGKLLNTIGIIEWHQKAYAEALKHYEKAFDIYHELKDPAHEGLMLNSIGITLHKLGRYEEALDRLRKAVEINRQAKEQLLEGHGLAAIGDIYHDLGEHKQAIYHYQASLEIRQKIGDHKGQGWMLHSLAIVYSDQDLYDKAGNYLTQAQVIAEECDDMELHRACNHIFNQFPGKNN